MAKMMSICITQRLSDGSGQSIFNQRIRLGIGDDSDGTKEAESAIRGVFKNFQSIEEWGKFGNSQTTSFATRYGDRVTKYDVLMDIYDIGYV